MNQIIQKMLELVHTIESIDLADEEQRTWAMWWKQHLRMAVEKARRAGWVELGGSDGH